MYIKIIYTYRVFSRDIRNCVFHAVITLPGSAAYARVHSNNNNNINISEQNNGIPNCSNDFTVTITREARRVRYIVFGKKHNIGVSYAIRRPKVASHKNYTGVSGLGICYIFSKYHCDSRYRFFLFFLRCFNL